VFALYVLGRHNSLSIGIARSTSFTFLDCPVSNQEVSCTVRISCCCSFYLLNAEPVAGLGILAYDEQDDAKVT
jgi:hypothetical protein